jgi:NTP pyrophosphatase (non-canonical NTP hydrolase)
MKKEINLKPGTIKNLQEYVTKKIEERGFADETLHERLVLLTEEVGELAKACRKISGMNVDSDKDIKYTVGEEITDVINMAIAVGVELNIDIEKEFLKKEAKNDQRIFKRSQEKIN